MILVGTSFDASDRILEGALETMDMPFEVPILGPGVPDLVKVVVETAEVTEIVSALAVAGLAKIAELAA